jgi:hypothetical protein
MAMNPSMMSPALLAAMERRKMLSGGGGAMMVAGDQLGGQEDPALLERLMAFFRSGGAQPEGREAADAMNAKLPDQLSARKAVLKKRKQMEDMDRMLQEE